MNKAMVSDEEVKEFIHRAQSAHFSKGFFTFEGRNIVTRDLFAPGVDTAQKARELILHVRSDAA